MFVLLSVKLGFLVFLFLFTVQGKWPGGIIYPSSLQPTGKTLKGASSANRKRNWVPRGNASLSNKDEKMRKKRLVFRASQFPGIVQGEIPSCLKVFDVFN